MGKIRKIFKRNKEFLLYLLFGVGTTVIDFGVSYLLYPTKLNIHFAHSAAWACAVVFAYVTNRVFVFESKARGKMIAIEALSFAGSRLLTLLIQEVIVFALYDKMGISEYIVK
ncbi:MAG: GtrA family protein, partial [Clostridia bacterium]|nr:GtrA family protein [Clostridia bacterium]